MSPDAHQQLLSFFTHWPQATGAANGALALGTLLALLVYFRHDWASQISCLLQVILFRRKPMTLDERLPLFILIAAGPYLLAGHFIRERISQVDWLSLEDLARDHPIHVPAIAAGLAFFGLAIAFAESMSRKNRGMFDWNWLDSLIAGMVLILSVFPGFGAITAIWVAGMLRGYNREATLKFGFFCLAPILVVESWRDLHPVDFHTAQPMPDMSWLSFGVAVVVACLSGLLAIGALVKHVERKGMMQYVAYRWVLAGVAVAVYFYRIRGEG